MKPIMVRYQIKAEMTIEDRRLIEAVFTEAQGKRPDNSFHRSR